MIRRFFAFLFIGLAASLLLCAASSSRWDHVPAKEHARANPLAAHPETATAGALVYREHCAQCHRSDAMGDGRKKPPLRSDHIRVGNRWRPRVVSPPGRSGSRHAVVVQPAGSPAVATRSLSAFDPVTSHQHLETFFQRLCPGVSIERPGKRASRCRRNQTTQPRGCPAVCRHPQIVLRRDSLAPSSMRG